MASAAISEREHTRMSIGGQVLVIVFVGTGSALVDQCVMQYRLLARKRSPLAVSTALSHSCYAFVAAPRAPLLPE